MKWQIKKVEKTKAVEKDWIDAFIEKGIVDKEQKRVDNPISVRIEDSSWLPKYSLLCGYVGLFERGGFWFSKKKGYVEFAINHYHETEATYEDALQYLNERM